MNVSISFIVAIHKPPNVILHRLQNKNSMIFKTTLKDINSTAVAIDKLNKVTSTIRSASIKDYTLYGTAIDGLNAKQLALALSTQNLTDEEMIAVFTENELIKKYGAEELIKSGLLSTNSSLLVSEKAITSEDMQKLLIKKGVNEEEAKAFIQKNLIIATNGEEATSTILLNKALMDEAVERGLLSEERAAEILSIYGIITADVAETASKKGLAKATWELVKSQAALLASNPITWIVLGLVALAGVLDLVTTSSAEYNKELNGLRDNLENVKSECSELESELKSYNNELTTTQERMKELEKIESPSFVEKEEYDSLNAFNNELERKIALLELEQKTKNSEKNKAFISTMQKDVNDGNEYWLEHDTGNIYKGDSFWAMFSGIRASDSTEADFIEQQFATRRRLLNELSAAETKEEKDRIQNSIIKIDSYLQSKSSEWNKDSEGINYIFNPTSDDDRAVNEWLDYIADFQDRMAIAISKEDAEANVRYRNNTFNRLVDNWKFDDAVQGLQDLGKEGKATAEMLDDPKYDEFINKLVFLGVIDSADNLDDVALAFNSVAIAAENAADSTEKYSNEPPISSSISKTIDQLNTKLRPVFDSLKSAWQDIFTDDGFDNEAVDIPMLDSIKSSIEEISKLGINIDLSAFDEFVTVLTNVNTKKGDAEKAFNDFATSIFYATGATNGMTAETKELVEQLLESLGITNASEVAEYSLAVAERELIETKAQAILATYDLINASNEDYVALLEEAGAAGVAKQQIYNLAAAEIAYGANDLSVEQKVEKLKELARAYGDTATAALATAVANDLASGHTDVDSALNDLMRQISSTTQDVGIKLPEIEFSGLEKKVEEAGSKSASSVTEAFTDALDKELTALDKKLEAGYIDFNDYIQARLTLIEDYYNQGKLSADEYYSYLEKHYDTQLSYMDKAVNAVTRRIDKEIDALKQQKENVEDIYKVQIESLEEEKNLLEEANKERQRQKDLQKSLYDLERARNQRTRLVYSENKGMHYAADDQSIRDAQENVDNAGYDIRIAEIDKSISKLEEARDKETNAIDEMISNLESYKDAWNDITSAYEEEQENLIAAQILGADWETDILNGRLDVLDAFKNQYIGIQQAMAAAAWESANEQIKAAKEAEKGSSGSTSNAPKSDSKKDKQKKDLLQLPTTSSGGGGGGGGSHSLGLSDHKLVYASLKAYSSGTNNAKKGLNLVGEGGTEAYFDNHGHVAIVTKPTLIPMEGGEVVKNERDTEKLLDPDNLAPVDTISVLTPIQPGSLMWDLQEKFNAYISKMGEDISSVMAPVDFIQKDMARTVNGISTTNNITNTGMQQVTIGDIHVTCPGVTSQEVARQVGVELNRQFSGFSLVALQESKK